MAKLVKRMCIFFFWISPEKNATQKRNHNRNKICRSQRSECNDDDDRRRRQRRKIKIGRKREKKKSKKKQIAKFMAFNAWNIFMCHNSELAQSIYRVAQRHVFAYMHRYVYVCVCLCTVCVARSFDWELHFYLFFAFVVAHAGKKVRGARVPSTKRRRLARRWRWLRLRQRRRRRRRRRTSIIFSWNDLQPPLRIVQGARVSFLILPSCAHTHTSMLVLTCNDRLTVCVMWMQYKITEIRE